MTRGLVGVQQAGGERPGGREREQPVPDSPVTQKGQALNLEYGGLDT